MNQYEREVLQAAIFYGGMAYGLEPHSVLQPDTKEFGESNSRLYCALIAVQMATQNLYYFNHEVGRKKTNAIDLETELESAKRIREYTVTRIAHEQAAVARAAREGRDAEKRTREDVAKESA